MPARRSYRCRPSASVTSSSRTACTNSRTLTRTHASNVSHVGLVLGHPSPLLLSMGDPPSTRTLPGLAWQPEGYVARSSFTHPLTLAPSGLLFRQPEVRCQRPISGPPSARAAAPSACANARGTASCPPRERRFSEQTPSRVGREASVQRPVDQANAVPRPAKPVRQTYRNLSMRVPL